MLLYVTKCDLTSIIIIITLDFCGLERGRGSTRQLAHTTLKVECGRAKSK